MKKPKPAAKLIVRKVMGTYYFALPTHGRWNESSKEKVHDFMKRNKITNYEIMGG